MKGKCPKYLGTYIAYTAGSIQSFVKPLLVNGCIMSYMNSFELGKLSCNV